MVCMWYRLLYSIWGHLHPCNPIEAITNNQKDELQAARLIHTFRPAEVNKVFFLIILFCFHKLYTLISY